MNTKISFLLLLVLLIILLLFYYIDLESNIIILLGIVIVLVIHNIITKKEHFNINEQAAKLDARISNLLSIAQALSVDSTSNQDSKFTSLKLTSSCPILLDENTYTKDQQPDDDVFNTFPDAINMGFNTDINSLTHLDLSKITPN
jgi:hypothetical protein